MHLNIDTIHTTTNNSDCVTIQELQQVPSQHEHLQQLKEYIIRDWSENKDQIPQDMRTKINCHKVPGKLWEVGGVRYVHPTQQKLLFIVDYHSMFPVFKKTKNHQEVA